MKPLKFPTKRPRPRVDYSSLPRTEQIKKVSLTLIYWLGDSRLSLVQRQKLKKIMPESLVQLFNEYDGWELYANRRIGIVKKVNIIIEMYEKVRE